MKRERQIYNALNESGQRGLRCSRLMVAKSAVRHHVSNVPHIAGSESATAAAWLRACLGGSEGKGESDDRISHSSEGS